MKLREKRQSGIVSKVYGYMAGFVVILLILLWLFQVVLLDGFYTVIKKGSIKSTAQTIIQNIKSENVEELLERISHMDNLCIRIVNEDLETVYSEETMPNCTIHKMEPDRLAAIYEEAAANKGSTFELITRDEFYDKNWNKRFQGEGAPPMHREQKSMVYAKLVKMEDGSKMMILLNSQITPLTATVETLRAELVYITFIMLVLAMFIAIQISKKLSKPIVKINESAKELAKGNYNVTFEGSGYREIAELNNTLNYAATELSKVEALRRELIANISHDLRTPLTMITGYAEVMRDLPGENTPENIQIIIDEAQRLSTLVSDILDISKLQSGTQSLNISRFSLTDSIQKILLRYNKLMEQGGYQILFRPDQDAWIEADEVKMSQVLYNLINNAINYTGGDKKIILSQTVENGWVKLEIKDTGEGIEQDLLPLIWDRYYKVDKKHRQAMVGTGLGLSIVKSVLELHHADYGVESTLGEGSNFWFALPLSEE